MANSDLYRADLAHIHDNGFSGLADHGAAATIELLQSQRIRCGLVVELGCGSGVSAAELTRAGYDVVGCDISPDMVRHAKQRAPAATLLCQSFREMQIPACVAVTAIGEVFNYLSDDRNNLAELHRFFRRVYDALEPEGLFLFDVATVGREPLGLRRGFREGDGWACLFEAEEDPLRKQLERRITTFRRARTNYRRDYEVHRLRLYESGELLPVLESLGFRTTSIDRYGGLEFPPGVLGVTAWKS